jgi:nucleoside recognition membrane protein YjiH
VVTEVPGRAVRNGAALTFVLPSLAGVAIFLTPLPGADGLTIGIGIITGWVRAAAGTQAVWWVAAVILLTALFTCLGSMWRVGWITRRPLLASLFAVSPLWVGLRLVSLAFVACYVFGVGPTLLQSEAVGGAVFDGIGTNMLAVYVAACILLPLLTDYGLMEFAGTLAAPLFQRLFRLPGQAAIDALTSIAGASGIGLLITIGQYERGAYTAREACVIATSFSIVSIPFSLVVATVAGVAEYFVPWYGTVLLACLAAALVLPRLPPLAGKPDQRFGGALNAPTAQGQDRVAGESRLRLAWRRALARASVAPGPRGFLLGGLRNLLFFAFAVVAATLALATLAALIVFHTSAFEWLGWPFVPLLTALGFDPADAAAAALFSGFLDQFMPALAAAEIDDARTSFVLAGLAVCQLVFLSEVGVIILRSTLPLGLVDLLLVFLLRTAVVLPVLVVGARTVVG